MIDTTVIAKLEKAEEGSRELDVAIQECLTGKLRLGLSYGKVPEYSRSVDAASSLVPEGYLWTVNSGFSTSAGPVIASATVDLHGQHYRRQATFSKTPALALCICALKARQSNEQ